MTCRADLLAYVRTVLAGAVVDEQPLCERPAVFDVTCQPAGVRDVQLTVGVCDRHQQQIESVVPGVRSVRRYSRAA